MKRAYMDRFIDTIEWIAAGFVGIVALNIFVGVLLRNTLNYAIPDSFDIGRMLLGILIFLGIAACACRRAGPSPPPAPARRPPTPGGVGAGRVGPPKPQAHHRRIRDAGA